MTTCTTERGETDGKGLSQSERLQFIPKSSFQRIFETAFDGLKQITEPAMAKNKLGQPLATIFILQPFSMASVEAILETQKISNTEKCDVRGFVLETNNDRGTETNIKQVIVEMWAKKELNISGHPPTTEKPYVSTSGSMEQVHHQLTLVNSSGLLQLAEVPLQNFLENPTTAHQAEAFLVKWRDQMLGPSGPVMIK